MLKLPVLLLTLALTQTVQPYEEHISIDLTPSNTLLFVAELSAIVLGCYRNPNPDDSCPYQDITYWLYTRNQTNGIQITMDNMLTIPVDKDKPWKIVFHGFVSSKESPGRPLREAYLSRGRYNVLLVDYQKPLEHLYCYAPAALINSDLVAKCTALFLRRMLRKGVLPPLEQVHLIGHSLGAHIAGDTGYRLFHRTNKKIGRITGLDPAGVLFSKHLTQPYKILMPEDAHFVDVHHTNGGYTLRGAGTYEQLGHVDIRYNDNDGGTQPGCTIFDHKCSHHRSIDYYAESINPLPPRFNKFIAISSVDIDKDPRSEPRHPTSVLVGEDILTNSTGNLFVTTNSSPPYAMPKSLKDMLRRFCKEGGKFANSVCRRFEKMKFI